MAGDKISSAVQYYYQNPVSNSPNSPTLISSVLASLVQTLTSTTVASAPLYNSAAGIGSNLSGPGAGALTALTDPNASDGSTNLPKAYLTILFFDERMQLVGENSSSERVSISGSVQTIALPNIQAPKNGYAFIYVSNESDVQAVYFDNFAVVHSRSKLLEETTYYPFGLKIQPLSAQAFQKPVAPDKFQGVYSDYEEEVSWNDFELRSYDPQTGRWLQVDPYDEFASPYTGMGNDWLNDVDEDGGWSAGFLAATTIVGATIGYLASDKDHKASGVFLGAGIGIGSGLLLNPILNKLFDPYVSGSNGNNGWMWRDKRFKFGLNGGESALEKWENRGFDAWLSDKVQSLFSDNFYRFGELTPKYQWVDKYPISLATHISKVLEKVLPDGNILRTETFKILFSVTKNYGDLGKQFVYNVSSKPGDQLSVRINGREVDNNLPRTPNYSQVHSINSHKLKFIEFQYTNKFYKSNVQSITPNFNGANSAGNINVIPPVKIRIRINVKIARPKW